MAEEFLTVAEFAKRAGVSRQAVYKGLKAKLSEYSKQVDGVQYISLDALSLFGVNQSDNIEFTTVDNKLTKVYKEQIEDLRKQIDILTMQLLVKDEQIKALNKQIEITQNQLDKQFQLTFNSQVLQLQDKQAENVRNQEDEPDKPIKKKSFFRRILD